MATAGGVGQGASCASLVIVYQPEVFSSEPSKSGPAIYRWAPGGTPKLSATTPQPLLIHDWLDTDTPTRLRSWIPGFDEVASIDLAQLRQETRSSSLSVRSVAGWLSPHELVFTVFEPQETTYISGTPYEDREFTYLRQGIAVWDTTSRSSRLVTALDSFREALFIVRDGDNVRVVFRSKGRKFGDLRLSAGQVLSEFVGSVARFSAVDTAGALIVPGVNDQVGLFVANASQGITKVANIGAAVGYGINERWVRGDVTVRADGKSVAFVTEDPTSSPNSAKHVSVRVYATGTGKRTAKPVSLVLRGSSRTQAILSATWFRDGVAVVDDRYIAYVHHRRVQLTKTRLSPPDLTSCAPS